MCKFAHWAGLKMCKILGRPTVKHFPFTLVQFAQKIRALFVLTIRARSSIIYIENQEKE